MSCFVVLSGKVDIAVPGLSGEQVFVTYGPSQLSGEVVLISGARALSRGRVAEPGEFLEIGVDELRTFDCEGCRAERYLHARIPLAPCCDDVLKVDRTLTERLSAADGGARSSKPSSRSPFPETDHFGRSGVLFLPCAGFKDWT